MNPFFNRINDLTLQGYQDDIALQNVLKQTKKVVLDDVNFKAFPRTPQAYAQKNATDLMMNDLINDIQIQTMLKNQIPQYRPKKIQSEVTEEMIKDYQQESKKPVEINGKLYKFVPPDLDLDLEEIPLNLAPEGLVNRPLDKEIEKKRSRYNEIAPEIALLVELIDKNADDYNKGKISLDDYMSNSDYLEDRFEDNKREARKLSDEIANLFNYEMLYKAEKMKREAEIDRVKKSNAKKLSAYEEALRLRNTGQEVAQQPDESDEDYAKRMLAVGNETVDPDDVKLDAQLYLYRNLKDKFGEFIEPYKVEGLLNTLVQQDGYEFLQKLKDRWPAVSKKIKETFGTLRKVDQETIIDFLTTEVFEPVKPREKEPEKPKEKEPEKPKEKELENVSTLTAKPTLETLKKNMSSRQRSRAPSNISDITESSYEAIPAPSSPLSPVAKRLRDRSMTRSQLSEPLSPNSQTRLTEPMNFDTWTKTELVSYANEHNIKGPRGGDPEFMKQPALLKLVKSKRPLTGIGIDPLKTRFEIVDGEIQAGNNNPKLIRDARKLLKQMVAKKMVNLYEAKSHMNYLKKIIKI
jgi:hypothetical protein